MKNVFPSVIRKVFVGLGAVLILGFVAWTSAGGIKTTEAATPCIVTIFGIQYDVTSLQTNHTGGNVFVCGMDMTAVYQSQHGTDVSRIAPYIVAATPTPTTVPTNTPTPTPTVNPSVTPSISPTPPVNNDHDSDEVDHDSDDINESPEEIHENVQVEIHEKAEIHEKETSDETRNDSHINQRAHVEINDDIVSEHDD
ncbi:MAG: hypothetical protein WC744_03750 [Patescibacteria group bacterium]|jgi:hypothetical protein